MGTPLVLIVDDDPGETAGFFAEKWRTEVAHDLLEALEVLSGRMPDAVAVDNQMPNADDGVAVGQELKRLYPDLYIVGCSEGWNPGNAEVAGLDAYGDATGAYAHLWGHFNS
ncbi:MAG: response regulator [archaeon]